MPRLAALLCLVLLTVGCTTPVVPTDVTRFSALGPAEAGRSFTIVPQDGQKGSLEFQRYAELVAAQLSQRGWRPVPAGNKVDTVVLLRWGTSAPRVESYQTPAQFGTGMGFASHSYMASGFYEPFPYWETRTATYFPRWIGVDIMDAAAWQSGTPKSVWEGRAVAEGSRPEIAPVIPYLVEALFTGFPGTSGQTVRVNVPR